MDQLNYDTMVGSYATHRRVSSFVIEELLQGSELSRESKVLEVGCGTGNHIAELVATVGCRGWGIDPSKEMLLRAPQNDRLHFQSGAAENIPFDPGFFDFVFSINVIHHVTHTLAHFREVFRILKPRGRICTVTDSEEIIRNRKPLSEYWPETVEVELKRYPAIPLLRQQMAGVGFTDVEARSIERTVRVTNAAPYRDKAFSCLHLISREAFQAGLRRLEKAMRSGSVESWSGYVCLWGRVP